jgi:hypothetical protein
MSMRLSRTATAALALAFGLVAVPACKKSKPTVPAAPSAGSGPTPDPEPPSGPRDPGVPQSPVFRAAYPLLAGPKTKALENLQQVGLAFQTYHLDNNAFPGGFYDASGRIGLSWRVALLPYLDEQQLFSRFKLDEPWDSDHNKALLPAMPGVFAPPQTSSNGYTFLRGFTGPHAWLNPRVPGRAGRRADGVSRLAIPDGPSKTILVAEAYDPVPWTKPDELAFAPGAPPRLGGVFESGFHVMRGDGGVTFLRKGSDPKTLADMIQIDDGNPVRFDE